MQSLGIFHQIQPNEKTFEARGLRKDSSEFPAEISIAMWETARGKLYSSIIRDITERKRAEQELQNRAEDLQVLNTIASIITQSFSLDAMLSATLDQVLGALHPQMGLIHLSDPSTGMLSLAVARGLPEAMIEEVKTCQVEEGIRGEIMQSGQPRIVEEATDDLWFKGAGEKRDLYPFIAVPLRSKENALGILSLFGCGPRTLSPQGIQLLAGLGHQISTAIEKFRLAENATEVQVLRGLDRLRSELVANVSHELRTPLGLIKLFSSNLLREDVRFSEAKQREFLTEIDREADKLKSAVDNLLDLARIESGRLQPDKRRADLREIIKNVVTDMAARAPAHHLVQELPSAPLSALVDANQVEQVLRNLISNAVKYSPPGSTITVRGIHEVGQILIQVSDQGIGISEGDLTHIFERFYRVDNEVTRRAGGVGLGLAICKGIVKAHGGNIWATSVLNEGSTFSFTLPVEVE
jgi:K+-sensing histidine kinase KdpD